MQITLTLELTAHNLEILKQLCDEPCENLAKPIEGSTPGPEAPAEKPARKRKTGADLSGEPVATADPGKPAWLERPAEEPAKTYTAADVKAVCLKFSKEGRQSELKAAFAKFGAKKLTEISEDDYPALMEELGNA